MLTRWGSIIGLLTSVQKNQQALLAYFQQKKPGIDQGKNSTLESIVKDYTFWEKLNLIKKIVDSINKIQYMSEAEDHKIYTVAANWNKIRAHLYSMADEDEDADLHHIAKVIWEKRYYTQIIELHVVAALLLLSNHNIKVVDLTTEYSFPQLMSRFFERYVCSEDSFFAMKHWFAFRDREDGFHANSEC